MCGIFGYVGSQKDIANVVLDSLKMLEYRGYDSWGIAVRIDKKLLVEKRIGKIGDATVHLPESALGIGHTRWATHGGVTEANAHPHLDCNQEISVVHNGIIENYLEIKKDLLKKGHTFVSETDTEVAAHLIEEFLKKEGFASAVRDAFNMMKGFNAFVVAYAPSKEIVACKIGSPLLVGKGKDEWFVSSDVTGILSHTKEILYLKDKEMVILGKDLQLLSLPDGKKLTPEFETIKWKIEEVKKGNYKHFMLKEIHEQPAVVRRIVAQYTHEIEHIAKLIKNAKGTFFIGAGTAHHASLAGAYLFSKIAKVHVNTAVASEFNYLEDFLNKRSLIIALSQSGETIDVVEPLSRAKEKGSKIVAITNVMGSSIFRMGDYSLLLGAGTEIAVASTKAYTAKLTLLFLITYAMINKLDLAKKLLIETANEMERLLKTDEIGKIVDVLLPAEHIYVIGRGPSYATALEAALKIKEVSYIHTEGLAGGELKHGAIALISKGTPCIVFAPHDETYQGILSNAMEIKARGGVIIGISSENSPIFDHFVEVKDTGEASLLSQVIVPQLLSYHLAVKKNYDPDKPRNLAKSVTVK